MLARACGPVFAEERATTATLSVDLRQANRLAYQPVEELVPKAF
jgi:hypothetical protein